MRIVVSARARGMPWTLAAFRADAGDCASEEGGYRESLSMNDDVSPKAEVPAHGLRIAELVAEVSRQFIDLPAQEVDQGIDGALRTIVDALGFDRGILTAVPPQKNALIVTHRYDARAPQRHVDVGDPLPLVALPWSTSQVLSGHDVKVADAVELAELAPTDAARLAEAGIRAITGLPVVVDGNVTAALILISERPSQLVHLDSLRTVVRIFASALDRKRLDLVLASRLRLTELVGDISRRFIDVPLDQIRESLDEALQTIAVQCDFKRAVLYELSDDRKRYWITHRYLAPGVGPTEAAGVEQPIEHFGYVASRLTLKKPIIIATEGSPEEAASERHELVVGRMTHAVVFPLVVGEDPLGAVTFAGITPPDPTVVEMLEVVGELFTSALQRERVERGLVERLRFEEALSQIGARLIDASQESFEALVDDALRTVGQALEFERVLVFRLSTDRRFFNLAQEWCGPGQVSFRESLTGLPIDEFGWPVTEIREGRAVIFGPHDIPEGAESARRVLARDNTRLLATVPLVFAGKVIGCIGFHRIRSTRTLSEEQLVRLRLVGDMIAGALARHGAQVSLEHSEQRFAQVVASALDGFAMISDKGVLLEWTAQAERILGWARGEMMGGSLPSILIERDRASVGSIADMYKRTLKIPGKRLELTGRHRDGTELPIELSISLLEQGDSTAYGVFIRDITDRKRAEVVRQQAFDEISRLKRQIEGERDYLREEIREGRQAGDLVGESPALERVIALIESVASTSATVLIRGESGVGKELIARAIHSRSSRSEEPLVKVNCASVPKELFESEFFGHVRGAFTGALKDRAGRFELADRGTLFLDEVGEIPLDLQAKLLRVLQEKEFERVGADKTRKVDVRIIAATNRDLAAEAAAGRFRKDLYYRLSVFPIEIPPLRERREDILPLAEHFLKIQRRNLGRPHLTLDEQQRGRLLAYDWPGNVRELQHVIERAVILAREGPLRLDLALPATSGGEPPASPMPKDKVLTDEALRALERDNLTTALDRCDWRISGAGGAAELLGLSPSTLRDRMRVFDIQRPKRA
jgi:PAS domain S-box-containing protein